MIFASQKKELKFPYDLIFGKNIHGFSGNDVSLEDKLQKI